MHHFRNKPSSPSTSTSSPPPTSPIVEYIKQELVTSRAKDRRALAASTSAIALSIASPSCDPTDVALDESGSSKESAWMAVYGAARIAIDTAKDCSDMLPPLKAVMVALSVLTKNYDVSIPEGLVPSAAYRFLQQTATNSEQIRDIETRVQSLSEVLTYPVGNQDREEKARREALRRLVLPLWKDNDMYLSCNCHSQEVG